MNGQNRKLITRRCLACGKWVAMRVDPADLERVASGEALVQDAMPYLSADERELLACSGVCSSCWHVLCPSDPLAYS